MARHDPERIVMVGTSLATHGGIASVMHALRSAGLFVRWPVDYIETHCDGTAAAKIACALQGLARYGLALLRHRRVVLHVHLASRASFWRKAPFMSMAHAVGSPYVIHLHGGGFAQFHGRCLPWQRRLIETYFARSSCVITVSERWSEWVRTVVPAACTKCIPNPVATAPAVQRPREAGLVAFVGRCTPAKGVHELVDAVAAVSIRHPRVRLECAGDGDGEWVARRAFERGVRGRVMARGWLGARERDELLARCAVFALPSHAEGLPVSLLEAMAAGCAVVASEVGGIPDVVVDGVNGLLVPPGDGAALARALARLLDDPEFAARLGREAHATVVRNHAPGIALARLGHIYTALGVRREVPTGPMRPRGLREVA